MEVLSLFGGAISGFIFRMLAQQSADRQEQFKMMIQGIKEQTISHNEASKRDKSGAGQWIRRFLVVSLVFGIIVGPFILPFFDKDLIIEVVSGEKSLFGIFSWGKNTEFYALKGYLLTSEVRAATLAVCGYYFGTSTARR